MRAHLVPSTLLLCPHSTPGPLMFSAVFDLSCSHFVGGVVALDLGWWWLMQKEADPATRAEGTVHKIIPMRTRLEVLGKGKFAGFAYSCRSLSILSKNN